MTPPYPSEIMFQIAVADWIRREVAQPGLWWTAVNPAPAKLRSTAATSKAAGMRAGVPDLLFLWNCRMFAIELKHGDGQLSPAQIDMHYEMRVAGCMVHEARTPAEVEGILAAYRIPARARFDPLIYGLQRAATSRPSAKRSR